MKCEKFIVRILDNEGFPISEKKFKSYRDIAKEYNIEYHHARHLHMIHKGEYSRKFNGSLLKLSKKLQVEELDIYDF